MDPQSDLKKNEEETNAQNIQLKSQHLNVLLETVCSFSFYFILREIDKSKAKDMFHRITPCVKSKQFNKFSIKKN